MKNRTNQRLEKITAGTLIVGVDVAKSVQWARFVDYRGVEIWKAVSFQNNRQGFESIVTRIREIYNMKTVRYQGNRLRRHNAQITQWFVGRDDLGTP